MWRFYLEGCSLPFLVQIGQWFSWFPSNPRLNNTAGLSAVTLPGYCWSWPGQCLWGSPPAAPSHVLVSRHSRLVELFQFTAGRHLWLASEFSWSKSSRAQYLLWQAVLLKLLSIQMCSIKCRMCPCQRARCCLVWLWIAGWLNLWWWL